MKRYRVLKHDFDYRANWLTMEIHEEWEEHIQKQWRDGRENIAQGLILQYGLEDAEVKRQDFIELGPKPTSVVAHHNRFAEQARRSFVIGGYCPALTGACSLGERILNHLVLELKDRFKGTPEYKKVYRKGSFDDWNLPIDTLEAWGVLLPEAVQAFRELREVRNRRAIHFNPDTDAKDREYALIAVKSLDKIIAKQFGATGAEPWFISGVEGGECYVKKEREQDPFVELVYLPCAHLVGPDHRLEWTEDDWEVIDIPTDQYEDREVSDEEFRTLRERAVQKQLA